MLVGGIVVHQYQVQLTVGQGPSDVLEEGHRNLVPVPVLAQTGDLPGCDV